MGMSVNFPKAKLTYSGVLFCPTVSSKHIDIQSNIKYHTGLRIYTVCIHTHIYIPCQQIFTFRTQEQQAFGLLKN